MVSCILKNDYGTVIDIDMILFLVLWRFRHVTNMMADAENILSNDESFGDTVDTQ